MTPCGAEGQPGAVGVGQQQPRTCAACLQGPRTGNVLDDCGHVPHCPSCDVSLTLHRHNASVLVCHHCNHHRPAPRVCERCMGSRVRSFGIGTQRVEDAARQLFPKARIARLDRDSTATKDAHTRIVNGVPLSDSYYRIDGDFSYRLWAYPLEELRVGFTRMIGTTQTMDCPGGVPPCTAERALADRHHRAPDP